MSVLGAVAGAVLGWLGQALGFRRQVLLGLFAIVVDEPARRGRGIGRAGCSPPAPVRGWASCSSCSAAPGLLTEVTAPLTGGWSSGRWGVYMPLGTGLATLVVPVAIAAVGWRGAWLIDAAVTAAVLLAVARWVPTSPARRPPGLGGLSRAIRSPGVMCLAVAFGFYAGAYLAVVGLLPTMLVGGGLSLAAAGLVTSIVSLANVPANLLGAVLQHRGVPRWVLLVAGSAWIALTVWGVLDPALPLTVRIASAVAFTLVVGIVPSAAFSGVVAMSAGTASAGCGGRPAGAGFEHRSASRPTSRGGRGDRRRLLGGCGRDAHLPRRRPAGRRAAVPATGEATRTGGRFC